MTINKTLTVAASLSLLTHYCLSFHKHLLEENDPLKTLKVKFSKNLYICETNLGYMSLIRNIPNTSTSFKTGRAFALKEPISWFWRLHNYNAV